MANDTSYASKTRTRREPVASFGSRTAVGCVREQNEDSLVVRPPLFVVADGMGGHAAGEVASEIAVHTIAELAPQDADAEALLDAVEKHAAAMGQSRAFVFNVAVVHYLKAQGIAPPGV